MRPSRQRLPALGPAGQHPQQIAETVEVHPDTGLVSENRLAVPLGAPHDGTRHVEQRPEAGLSGHHELRWHLKLVTELVQPHLETLDHLRGDQRLPGSELGPVCFPRREFSHEHPQITFHSDQPLIQIGVRNLGPGQPDEGLGLVHGAVGVRQSGVLGNTTAEEQPGCPVITFARVDLHNNEPTDTR